MPGPAENPKPRVSGPRYWNGPTGWLIGDPLEQNEIIVDAEGVDWPRDGVSLRERLTTGSRASFESLHSKLTEAIEVTMVENPEAVEKVRAGDLGAVDPLVAKVSRLMRGVADVTWVRELVMEQVAPKL
ncbi:MAG: hypothetical protein ABIO06_10200 [Pseudolysinimonas sp.]